MLQIKFTNRFYRNKQNIHYLCPNCKNGLPMLVFWWRIKDMMLNEDGSDAPEIIVDVQMALARLLEEMTSDGFTELVINNPETGEKKVFDLRTGKVKE